MIGHDWLAGAVSSGAVIVLFMSGCLRVAFALGILFLSANDVEGCSVVRFSQVDPATEVTEVIEGSAVIVRARAVGYLAEPENRIGIIRFSVTEVLRGERLSEVMLHGELVDRDDFNRTGFRMILCAPMASAEPALHGNIRRERSIS